MLLNVKSLISCIVSLLSFPLCKDFYRRMLSFLSFIRIPLLYILRSCLFIWIKQPFIRSLLLYILCIYYCLFDQTTLYLRLSNVVSFFYTTIKSMNDKNIPNGWVLFFFSFLLLKSNIFVKKTVTFIEKILKPCNNSLICSCSWYYYIYNRMIMFVYTFIHVTFIWYIIHYTLYISKHIYIVTKDYYFTYNVYMTARIL